MNTVSTLENTTITPVPVYSGSTPQVTVNVVCRRRSRHTRILIWCLRAICWHFRASLVVHEP